MYTNAKNMPKDWPAILCRLNLTDLRAVLNSEVIKKNTMYCMNSFIQWCRNRHSRNIIIPDYNIEDFLSAFKIFFHREKVFENDDTSETRDLFDKASKLVLNFDAMVVLFRNNVLDDIIHKEGITLAEQIAFLSTQNNDADIFEKFGFELENLLREYLLTFFHWRGNNKSQIMKKNIRDTIYKFLEMITINGEKRLDFTNSEVGTLQRDISRLRILIDSHIRNEPPSAVDFPKILENLDNYCANALVFIEGCGKLVCNIDRVEEESQQNTRRKISRQIGSQEFHLNNNKFQEYKDNALADLITNRQNLEELKRRMKSNAVAIGMSML